MKRQVIMTEGNPGKLLISFAIPILIGSLFQQVYSLADRIIVGRFVGSSAFAAVGSTNALSMMFMSMCMGSAIGTGVVVAQYFGAKDERNTAKAIANSTWVNGLIAVMMTVLALLLGRPIMGMFVNDKDITRNLPPLVSGSRACSSWPLVRYRCSGIS